MFARLFRRSRFDDRSHDLYEAVVAQARQPGIYRSLAVPDSLDGRFDAVVLHAWLAMRRLRRAGPGGEAASQALFDIMFADFDRSLREIGVGDLRVGKRIKQMAQAFYGRARHYDEAVDGEGMEPLRTALRRNLYGTSEPAPEVLSRAADYVMEQERWLAGLDDADLVAGRLSFSPAPGPLRGADDPAI